VSETALLKSRKWKKFSFGETFEQMTFAFLLNMHSWYGCPFAGIPISRREVTGGVT